MKNDNHMRSTLKMEKYKSIKNHADSEYEDWQTEWKQKHKKDAKRLDLKQSKLEEETEKIKEDNQKRFNKMRNKMRRIDHHIQQKKEWLLDKEINNRERVKKMSLDRQKAIQNQMEINRIVQQQAHNVSFG